MLAFLWALALPLLGVCVFFWGLGYKMSLYDPPQSPSHQMPEAKLLSKNEQPEKTGAAENANTKESRTAPAISFAALLFLAFWLSGRRFESAGPVFAASEHRKPSDALLRIHFVRPPPVLA